LKPYILKRGERATTTSVGVGGSEDKGNQDREEKKEEGVVSSKRKKVYREVS